MHVIIDVRCPPTNGLATMNKFIAFWKFTLIHQVVDIGPTERDDLGYFFPAE
jgi:hypothetical protein